MKKNNARITASCVFLLAAVVLLQGEIIHPVAMRQYESNMTYFNNRVVHNIINGSGMSTNPVTADATHDSTLSAMWMSWQPAGRYEIVFELGAWYDLSSALIWNIAQRACPERCVDSMAIRVSHDSVLVESLFTVIDTFDLSVPASYPVEAEHVACTADSVRLVMFDIISNVGRNQADGGGNVVGLSEVRFEGTLVAGNSIRHGMTRTPGTHTQLFEVQAHSDGFAVKSRSAYPVRCDVYTPGGRCVARTQLSPGGTSRLRARSGGMYILMFRTPDGAVHATRRMCIPSR